MGNYEHKNGVLIYQPKPLDYLYSILYVYEWLMLLKADEKPYDIIIDQLYNIAQKKRYGNLNLNGSKLTIKWISEQLQIKPALFSKWIGMIFKDIQSLNTSKPELFKNEGEILCTLCLYSPHDDFCEFNLGFKQIPRIGDNISFYFARAIINEGCFVVTDIDIDHEYGKNSIYIECKPRYLEDEYRNWLLNKAYFLRDLDYASMPKESYILDSMLRTYAREGKMPDVEKVKKAWGIKSK